MDDTNGQCLFGDNRASDAVLERIDDIVESVSGDQDRDQAL